MIREDYLLRMIRQLADALARIAGRRRAGEYDLAQQEIDAVREQLLAGPRELLDQLDSASLAQLLGDPDTIRTAALLAWEEGRIFAARADPLAAFARYRRAHELWLEARAAAPHPDDDTALLELARLVPGWHLADRYRDPRAPADAASALVEGGDAGDPLRG